MRRGLATWVRYQRKMRENELLDADRIRRLDGIGFCWGIFDEQWGEMFSALVEFNNTFGHCNVPLRHPENRKLGRWVSRQRELKKLGQLEEQRTKLLDSIGFDWDPLDASWQEMCSSLMAYKAKYGHCNVPPKMAEWPKLGVWVSSQRTLAMRGRLEEERIEKLNELGFSWNQKEAYWEENFSTLLEFKRTHGHCNVPQGRVGSKSLSVWVRTQREAKRQGRLSENRQSRLEEIHFCWDRPIDSWEENFSRLPEFRTIHGDCNVPATWNLDRKLGSWCRNQRTLYKTGALSPGRIKRLEEIGFQWEIKKH
jgi:hypothetical protein